MFFRCLECGLTIIIDDLDIISDLGINIELIGNINSKEWTKWITACMLTMAQTACANVNHLRLLRRLMKWTSSAAFGRQVINDRLQCQSKLILKYKKKKHFSPIQLSTTIWCDWNLSSTKANRTTPTTVVTVRCIMHRVAVIMTHVKCLSMLALTWMPPRKAAVLLHLCVLQWWVMKVYRAQRW